MKDLNEAATQATMFPHSFALWDNIKFVLTHPDYKIARMFKYDVYLCFKNTRNNYYLFFLLAVWLRFL